MKIEMAIEYDGVARSGLTYITTEIRGGLLWTR